MPDSFGARLRQRREERQIALTSIADDTKIKLTLLEALERDDVSHWPSGIFRRAYIKAYAHMIGLDPDEVAREFLEVHPEPAEVAAAAALAAAEEAARKAGPPPTRLRNIVDSALGSLVRLRRTSGVEDSTPPAPCQVPTELASNRLVILGICGRVQLERHDRRRHRARDPPRASVCGNGRHTGAGTSRRPAITLPDRRHGGRRAPCFGAPAQSSGSRRTSGGGGSCRSP